MFLFFCFPVMSVSFSFWAKTGVPLFLSLISLCAKCNESALLFFLCVFSVFVFGLLCLLISFSTLCSKQGVRAESTLNPTDYQEV